MLAGTGFTHTLIDIADEGGGKCSGIHLTVVNFTAGKHSGISGNGVAMLMLRAEKGEEITVPVASDILTIRGERDLHLPFTTSILGRCESALGNPDIKYTHVRNFAAIPGIGCDEVRVKIENTEVLIHPVNITVSAYQNRMRDP
ncbi:MAG: hypothetical protein JXA08_00440 [Methanomicrobiaceae archaeon]|nr:hypothetical protein [Methanomicrobiaceae archaeon]